MTSAAATFQRLSELPPAWRSWGELPVPPPNPRQLWQTQDNKSKRLLEDTLHFLVSSPSPTSILRNPRPSILGDPKIGCEDIDCSKKDLGQTAGGSS